MEECASRTKIKLALQYAMRTAEIPSLFIVHF